MKLCYKAFFILVALLLTPLSGYSNSANIFDSSSVESNVNVLHTDKGIPPNSQVIIPSLNYKDADIRDILKSIALEYQTNIAIDNQINKRITISLFDLRVFDAVKIIAEDNHFDFKHDSLRFTISMKNQIANNEESNSQCEISVIKDMLNMNLRNVSIEQFVSTLHQKTQKNILISNGVHGNLSGRLSNVTFEKGLTHILNNNGFKLNEVDSFYYIAKIQNDDINNSDNLHIANSKVSISNGKVSLNISKGKLDNILDELSNKLNLQMIKLIVPEEEVTIKCREIDIETAIDYLFRGTEYSYKIENGVYIIGEKKSNKLNLTRLIKLKYLRAEDLVIPANVAADLISSVSKEHNGIVVTGAKEDLLKIIEYIESIDKPVPQVMIEALVIDYNLDNIYQFGLSAGNGDPAAGAKPDKFFPGLDVTVSGSRINKVLKDIGSVNIFGKDHNISKLGNLSDDFYINLKAMEEEGFANVRSRPILSTLNGHTASLKIGQVQNYVFTDIMPVTSTTQTTFIEKERIEKIEANVSFEITPWVGPNDELTLEIKPDFQTPVGKFSPDKKLIPAINTRSFESTVRLKDGETIILGGLIQETEILSEEKFPILGDIPLLGLLFKSVNEQISKSELIIYLTPRIMYNDNYEYLYYNYSENRKSAL